MIISPKSEAADHDRFREGVVQWVTDLHPTHFLTFAFNRPVTREAAERDFAKFLQWLHRAITGKRNCDGAEFNYRATVEHEKKNLHIHAVFRVSDEWRNRFEHYAAKKWKKLRAAGDLDVRSVYDEMGIARYITKETSPDDSLRLLF